MAWKPPASSFKPWRPERGLGYIPANMGDKEWWRSYAVVITLHGFSVQKDERHICWALSFEDGKQKIDQLLGPQEAASI